MRDYERRCPVCDEFVHHNHRCRSSEVKYKPLEGEDALEAVRKVKQTLLAVKHGEQVPTKPYQPSMQFGSEGL